MFRLIDYPVRICEPASSVDSSRIKKYTTKWGQTKHMLQVITEDLYTQASRRLLKQVFAPMALPASLPDVWTHMSLVVSNKTRFVHQWSSQYRREEACGNFRRYIVAAALAPEYCLRLPACMGAMCTLHLCTLRRESMQAVR